MKIDNNNTKIILRGNHNIPNCEFLIMNEMIGNCDVLDHYVLMVPDL